MGGRLSRKRPGCFSISVFGRFAYSLSDIGKASRPFAAQPGFEGGMVSGWFLGYGHLFYADEGFVDGWDG